MALMNGHGRSGEGYEEEHNSTVQELRRAEMFGRMLNCATAAERAANLVMGIVQKHEGRMQLDDEQHLVIVGRLAIYRVDIASFMAKFVNPFDYNSFDVVEVHPKNGLVKSHRRPASKFSRKRTCLHTICLQAISSVFSTMK